MVSAAGGPLAPWSSARGAPCALGARPPTVSAGRPCSGLVVLMVSLRQQEDLARGNQWVFLQLPDPHQSEDAADSQDRSNVHREPEREAAGRGLGRLDPIHDIDRAHDKEKYRNVSQPHWVLLDVPE